MDEGDPLMLNEERPDDDDDNGNTTQPFQPGSSSTPRPSGEEYPMRTTTINRPPVRRQKRRYQKNQKHVRSTAQ